MKNPFKPERAEPHHDNPVIPDAVERPLERAGERLADRADRAADRGARHDNPFVPNAIERPIERAAGDGRAGAADVRANTARAQSTTRPSVVDRPLDDRIRGDGRDDTPSRLRHSERSVTASGDGMGQVDLFEDEELHGYRTRWEAIQAGFVDEPRAAVEQADALVSQIMNRLTDVFTRERSTLEGQWSKGDDASTEDLRVALTRYRSFFHRLLSMQT